MSRGGSSIFLSLLIVFCSLLLVIGTLRGLLLYFLPSVEVACGKGFLNNLYVTFIQMTSPGNMNQDVQSAGWFKIPAIFSGMVGLAMISSLVASITTALDQKISQLKKGHSKVIETGHTLLLGWNDRVIEILRELVLANESEDDPVVVILAGEDKEEMDDFLKLNLPNTLNTRIVTRSGSPSSLVNLELTSVTESKSVIVLADCNVTATDDQKDASDANVIKMVLALVASRPAEHELNIVAEIFSERNREIVEDISPDEVTTIDTEDILAKILVQTSRSVGLSVVYNEILSFDGCEMYFHEAQWGEKKFGELAYHFPDGVPMGLRHADGSLSVNPNVNMQVKPGDSVLILAEDDSTIDFQAKPVASPREFELAGGRRKPLIEQTLIIGWSQKVEIILREYAEYVENGSFVDIMLRSHNEVARQKLEALNAELMGVEIELIEKNPLSNEGLVAVEPFQIRQHYRSQSKRVGVRH